MATDVGEEDGNDRAGRLYRQGNDWFCRSGLRSDIVIEVERILFHLHKFPLISKCGKIAQIIKSSQNTEEDEKHILVGCPGGPDGFSYAARFCYDNIVELKPTNILMVHCVADFLEMTEEYSEENLLKKTENFINAVLLQNWKDCLGALQSFQDCASEAEHLQIVQKCVNALSVMACKDPTMAEWPMMMYGSLQSPGGSILWNGINTGATISSTISDWWFDDISCLSYPMFMKFIQQMNARSITQEIIADAVMYYARRYLPGLDRWRGQKRGRTVQNFSRTSAVGQMVPVESILELLPEVKGKSYCHFLLGLLRHAAILDIDQSSKGSLEKKIGMQFEFVTLNGLLVPNFSGSDSLYDTDCVERIIQHFLSFQGLNNEPFLASSTRHVTLPSFSHLKRVTKLIDKYLAEIASDVDLKPQKIQSLLQVLPGSLRRLDDGLYRALDIYLRDHPFLGEDEREQLCRSINWGKLSPDACIHASQNERLPLRVILQVLFFEQQQLRTVLSNFPNVNMNEKDAQELVRRDDQLSLGRENLHLRVDMELLQAKVGELEEEVARMKHEMDKFSTRSYVSTKIDSIPVVLKKDRTHITTFQDQQRKLQASHSLRYAY
ncbi:hypothetical protein HPP92_009546 [Vanilla planifolia]|uniref:NPH3 domain-containing protein n=2 Tax=Vanilla planifolia TaxID=51239 RepID=A0A835V8Y7_VANPL|nr:hypothetical protein HPP92_009546 [Vanilla planifolia]